MRRWLILAALLLPWTLAAQTGVTVTARWDLDPSHDAPGLTWELERAGVIYPCGPVTVTASDRRCPATVPALAGVYRLRGVTASGEPGPWSAEGSGSQTAPGQFVITWHSPITLTEPEPSVATRFYFPSSGAAPVSPAYGAGWAHTSNADRLAMVTTRISSAMTDKAGVGTAATNENQLWRQYVSSQALAAQTISGTVKGQVRVKTTSGDPGAVAIRVAVCSSDGSTVTELTSVQYSSRSTTPPRMNGVTTLTNRRFEEGTSDFAVDLASTAVSTGDYLVVEIGWRDLTPNTGRWLTASFGDDSASDLPEDETTTTADNPWVEFSETITFAGGGGADAEGALNAPAPTLAASITVARTVSGALTVPPAVLAASSSVARSASGALVVPPSTLAAAVAVDRSASVAMNIGMPSLAATSTVGRSASGALGLPATTLSATITIAREVAGALVVAPLSLAATVESGRTASGALTLPPPTLSAAAARVVDVDGALTLPVPTLTAAVSVARFASGELALAVPVLAASVETEALTVSAALVLPMPVLDADAMVSRTASGALTLAMPVLDGDAIRAVQVDGVLLLRGLTTDAIAAIARLASGDLDAPALMAQANAIIGALQPVLLTRADVVSLVPSRDVLSLMPVRTVEAL